MIRTKYNRFVVTYAGNEISEKHRYQIFIISGLNLWPTMFVPVNPMFG